MIASVIVRTMRVLTLGWVLATAGDIAEAAGESAYKPETVALDVSRTDVEATCILGESAGQTFLAADTLIRSITLWIVNDGQTYRPTRLWITRVDSTGRPLTRSVLYQSGILRPTPDSNPEHRWIPARFAFDPPFALPGPGRYAAFLQDPCLLLVRVALNEFGDLYPGGQFWFTSRAGPVDCGLAPAFFYDPRSDAIFEIEFCRDDVTPVRRRTWGGLKVIYR